MKYYSLNLAYEILSDAHLRYTYDMHGFSSMTGQITMLFTILNNLLLNIQHPYNYNKNDIKVIILLL